MVNEIQKNLKNWKFGEKLTEGVKIEILQGDVFFLK